MSTSTVRFPRSLAPGALAALLSVLLGYGLGGVFGGNEEALMGRLKSSATEVFVSVYEGDRTRMDGVVTKSWTYMKRAHLHWGSMGAVALGAIALLSSLGGAGRLGAASALSLGLGAVLYGLFWMLAGLAAPGLGGTGEAKNAYEFVAVPGAGLSILGVVGVIICVVKETLRAR